MRCASSDRTQGRRETWLPDGVSRATTKHDTKLIIPVVEVLRGVRPRDSEGLVPLRGIAISVSRPSIPADSRRERARNHPARRSLYAGEERTSGPVVPPPQYGQTYRAVEPSNALAVSVGANARPQCLHGNSRCVRLIGQVFSPDPSASSHDTDTHYRAAYIQRNGGTDMVPWDLMAEL